MPAATVPATLRRPAQRADRVPCRGGGEAGDDRARAAEAGAVAAKRVGQSAGNAPRQGPGGVAALGRQPVT